MSGPGSFAQWGEDLLVWDYFQHRTHGFFIEVGANDPVSLSQTYLLEQNGWEGILVEPQAVCCEKLRKLRPRSKVIEAACGAPEQRGKALFRVASSNDRSALAWQEADADVICAGTVEVDLVTLDEVLQADGNPKPDFVSIDVEGGELAVLQGFNLTRFQPALLVVEDHVHDLRLHRYLLRHQYKLVKRTGSNNWYVPKTRRFEVGLGERLRLWRKMYAATPLRQLKRWLRRPRIAG